MGYPSTADLVAAAVGACEERFRRGVSHFKAREQELQDEVASLERRLAQRENELQQRIEALESRLQRANAGYSDCEEALKDEVLALGVGEGSLSEEGCALLKIIRDNEGRGCSLSLPEVLDALIDGDSLNVNCKLRILRSALEDFGFQLEGHWAAHPPDDEEERSDCISELQRAQALGF